LALLVAAESALWAVFAWLVWLLGAVQKQRCVDAGTSGNVERNSGSECEPGTPGESLVNSQLWWTGQAACVFGLVTEISLSSFDRSISLWRIFAFMTLPGLVTLGLVGARLWSERRRMLAFLERLAWITSGFAVAAAIVVIIYQACPTTYAVRYDGIAAMVPTGGVSWLLRALAIGSIALASWFALANRESRVSALVSAAIAVVVGGLGVGLVEMFVSTVSL